MNPRRSKRSLPCGTSGKDETSIATPGDRSSPRGITTLDGRVSTGRGVTWKLSGDGTTARLTVTSLRAGYSKPTVTDGLTDCRFGSSDFTTCWKPLASKI